MQCKIFKESGEAELISAMAGGWNSKLIVETWSHGGTTTTSTGLAIAASHSGGRHVCIVQNEQSRLAYVNAMQNSGVSLPEIFVGEAEDVAAAVAGVDFLVLDGRSKDFCRLVGVAKLSHRGAVLVCKNASERNIAGFRWGGVLDKTTRVVRALVLPVGNGLDIAYVATSGGAITSPKGPNRWIKRIDHKSGEEHVFRG